MFIQATEKGGEASAPLFLRERVYKSLGAMSEGRFQHLLQPIRCAPLESLAADLGPGEGVQCRRFPPSH